MTLESEWHGSTAAAFSFNKLQGISDQCPSGEKIVATSNNVYILNSKWCTIKILELNNIVRIRCVIQFPLYRKGRKVKRKEGSNDGPNHLK